MIKILSLIGTLGIVLLTAYPVIAQDKVVVVPLSSSSSTGAVMYLQSYTFGSTFPNECPEGWNEADINSVFVSGAGSLHNKVRTCYVLDVSCQVMYLQGSSYLPKQCPGGWIEADVKGVWSDVGHYNTVRTCYICKK